MDIRNAHWDSYVKTTDYPVVKNKNVKAVLLTSENWREIAEQSGINIQPFTEEAKSICTGFLSLQALPCYMVWINPRAKIRSAQRYQYINEKAFEINFTEKEIKT